MKQLLDLLYLPRSQWDDNVRQQFSQALRDRYPRVPDLTDRKNDERRFQLRLNSKVAAGSVPYAALVAPDQELSGPYGGMSFVVFPADEDGAPALVAMGVGTNGLSPDEAILGRPGHARKCAAITAWLNRLSMKTFAWAKRDPVRTDLSLPDAAAKKLQSWGGACQTYGKVLYAVYAPVPTADRTEDTDNSALKALTAFIDLFFAERGITPKSGSADDAEEVRRAYLAHVLPTTTDDAVASLLAHRRFAIIEGPPGTGKTEMARRLLASRYGENGQVIQFHPNTTYESFVGGLAPDHNGSAQGLSFKPEPGHLMTAASAAASDPSKPFLLVIDEINRADLAKVLGEAIYLLEPDRPERVVRLQYDFPHFGKTFSLPKNLHILGTMNSADRSIAILDVAVRRRFSFTKLWPSLEVVESHSGEALQTAFHALLEIFIDHANDDALALLPGHAYFIGDDDAASDRLSNGLGPLLEEYLAQGYVAGFADEVRAYIDAVVRRTAQ